MHSFLRHPGLALLFGVALSPSLARADTPPSAPTNDETTTTATAEAHEPYELDVLPGFEKTTRDGRTVYCRTEQKVGTRFKTENCVDETRVRIYLDALINQKQELEQLRDALNRIH